jgi:hypothetical protein
MPCALRLLNRQGQVCRENEAFAVNRDGKWLIFAAVFWTHSAPANTGRSGFSAACSPRWSTCWQKRGTD